MPLKKRLERFWWLFRATPLKTLFLVLTYRKPQAWEHQWHVTRLHIPLVIAGERVVNKDVEMRCCYEGSWFLGDDAWVLRIPGKPETATLIR